VGLPLFDKLFGAPELLRPGVSPYSDFEVNWDSPYTEGLQNYFVHNGSLKDSALGTQDLVLIAGAHFNVGPDGEQLTCNGSGDALRTTNSYTDLNGESAITIISFHNLDTLGVGTSDDGSLFARDSNGEDGSILFWYNYNADATDRTYSFNVGDSFVAANRIDGTDDIAVAGRIQPVAGVMNGGARKLYVDGVLNASSTGGTQTTVGTSSTYPQAHIGYWPFSGNFDLDGSISATITFKGELSADFIKAICDDPRGTLLKPREYDGPVLVSAVTGNVVVLPPVGILGLTGYAPTILISDNKTVIVPVGASSLVGVTPTILTPNPQVIDVPVGTFSLNGLVPDLLVSNHQSVTIPVASITLLGQVPTIVSSDHKAIDVPVGVSTLSGQIPTITESDHKVADIPVGSTDLIGQAPTVLASDHKTVDIPVGNLSITGYVPTITTDNSKIVQVPSAAIDLTGFAPIVSVTEHQFIDVPTGVTTITGEAPSILVSNPQVVDVPVAILNLTGYNPDIGTPITIAVPVGVLSLNGEVPTVNLTGNMIIDIPVTSLTLSGNVPNIIAGENQVVDIPVGSLTITGYAPNIIFLKIITPDGRIIMIEAESRISNVEFDYRVSTIESENRIDAIE